MVDDGMSAWARDGKWMLGSVAALVLLLWGWGGASPQEGAEPGPTAEVPSITISADFDNGSVGDWEVVGPDRVRFTLTKASGGIWFHFRIRGVKGRTITFVVPMTRDLNALTAHYYDGRNRPAYSYDRKHWHLAPPGRVDKEAKTFSFQVTFEEDEAWVAYSVPYTNDTLRALIDRYRDSPYLKVCTLATTAQGRPVYGLVIGRNPQVPKQGGRHSVWLVARENGWEAPASWVADGFVRFALGSSKESQEFRNRVIAHVVPIVSPDAVAGGWMLHPVGEGKQVYLPWAYNRDYPEVEGLKEAVRQWMAQGNTIDYALRVSSYGWLSRQHELREEFYLPQEVVAMDGLADYFHRFVPEARWTKGALPGHSFLRFCFRDFQVKGATLTVGLGAKDNEMTAAQLQDLGQALAEVILRLYLPVGSTPASGP